MKNTSTYLNGTLNEDEFGEVYAGYIEYSRDEKLFRRLDVGRHKVNILFANLDDEKALFRYAEGKWSVKEILGHLTDTERIMGYRALCIARNDKTELPGYDHDKYVAESNFDMRSVHNLIEDYKIVRESTISLFHTFTNEMLLRKGTVNGNPFSARALGYVISGHELHHLEILQERYFPNL